MYDTNQNSLFKGDYENSLLNPEQLDRIELIYILSKEENFFDDLIDQLTYFGCSIAYCSEIRDLVSMISNSKPSVIIIDTDYIIENREVINEIRKLKTSYIDIPVFFVTKKDDFDTRLRVVKAGGDALFREPFEVSELIDSIDKLNIFRQNIQYKVLIVDDDQLEAQYYSSILRSANMIVKILMQPERILKTMTEFNPELVLVDIHNSRLTDLEITAIIRQETTFICVPVILLSSGKDTGKQLEAMRIGSDDFLIKPIIPEFLISTVTARAKRLRILRSFMIRDSSTGLLNHTGTKEQLNIQIVKAKRDQSRLSYAMIDIDDFKIVNDTYGHLIGDRVLKNLARLFKQLVRKTDIIGRYGGDEFAIILPDTSLINAMKVLDRIRNNFANIKHQSEFSEFNVTFSCGISSFPECSTDQIITTKADKALYKAKSIGKNCVLIA